MLGFGGVSVFLAQLGDASLQLGDRFSVSGWSYEVMQFAGVGLQIIHLPFLRLLIIMNQFVALSVHASVGTNLLASRIFVVFVEPVFSPAAFISAGLSEIMRPGGPCALRFVPVPGNCREISFSPANIVKGGSKRVGLNEQLKIDANIAP